MKRTLLFIMCVLASITMWAQEDSNDYIPFVELGKQWHLVINPTNPNVPCSFETFKMFNEVQLDGKTYVKLDKTGYVLDTLYQEAGLFREEDRRVYKYEGGRDIMLYDFSLKEGDTFTYEFEPGLHENCKVLKQGWLEDGPLIVPSNFVFPDSGIIEDIKYRKLRTWTIGRDNGLGEYLEAETWVEGAGRLRNMFYRPDNVGIMCCLAYIEREGRGFYENAYLPFSLYNMYGPVYGCDLPAGEKVFVEGDGHQLTYELEGDRMHIFGKVLTICGNNYAFFYEKPTDDPLVHKIEFRIQEAEPIMDCVALQMTDFYVSGFNPNLNYIVVDNYGEEHPVINKTPQTAYRPFIEGGKVWKVGTIPTDLDSPVQIVDYYYFDGDTIIDGKTCKQMMCQRYVSPDYSNEYWTPKPSLKYVGAWYEENQKVYSYDEREQSMVIKYDFSLEANDTLQFLNEDGYPPFIIGPKQMGGIKGFKGIYRDIMMGQNIRNTIWLEGVGGLDAPFRNVYDPRADLVPEFLMSCVVGDEVIYLNDVHEDGATPAGARKNRFDFTHTIKVKPKARTRNEEDLSLYGEYNERQLSIDLNPISDAYQVRITNESGKAVYEKIINAGRIVALNIDISTYPNGHYTVTVENSNESFTGEFNAQKTGIQEVRMKKEDSKSYIYNLQGQRISSLQKGLNIVNGRKVFVK